MKTRLRAAVVAIATGATLVAATPAQAEIAFSQTVALRNDPTASAGVKLPWTSFADGAKNCSTPLPNTTCFRKVSKGTISAIPRTYVLKEENRSLDYYVFDLTVNSTRSSGDKGWGFFDATIKSTSDVRSATHSQGRTAGNDDCKSYDINIGAGWGPVTAGSKVGTFKVDCHPATLTSEAVTAGRSYHLSNLGAVKSVTMQRFVVVPAGTKPTFSWKVTAPTDGCRQYRGTGPSGTTQEIYSCQNGTASRSGTIGTRG